MLNRYFIRKFGINGDSEFYMFIINNLKIVKTVFHKNSVSDAIFSFSIARKNIERELSILGIVYLRRSARPIFNEISKEEFCKILIANGDKLNVHDYND